MIWPLVALYWYPTLTTCFSGYVFLSQPDQNLGSQAGHTGRPRRLRPGKDGPDPELLPELLPPTIPPQKIRWNAGQSQIISGTGVCFPCALWVTTCPASRPDCAAGLQCWRHGELGPDHIQGDGSSLRQEILLQFQQRTDCIHHLPRAGSHGMLGFSYFFS